MCLRIVVCGVALSERQAELRAAREPRRRPVARLAEHVEHIAQNGEDGFRAERVAERKRPARITEAEHHGQVDVFRRRNLLLRDVAADVDDRCHHALGDEPRRVANDGDRHAVRGKERVAGVARGARGGGRGHQRAALGADERKERVDGDDAARVERFVDGGRGGVVAERCDDNQRIGGGRRAFV